MKKKSHMCLRIRPWEWYVSGGVAIAGLLELWLKDFSDVPHFWVILFWLTVLRIYIYGLAQFWRVLTRKDMQEVGKEHDELVNSFHAKIKNDIEMFGRNFLKGKTIDDYKKSHPESFKGRKFIACHECGGRSVWVKQMGSTRYGIHNQHICRTCGVALWRSNL